MRIEIRPLSPECKEDYLSFFDSVEFLEHPHWADCYCYSYHFTGPPEEWIREQNRNCVSAMIDEGSMKGYLAYHEDQVVAWCNANQRSNYQLLTKTGDLVDPQKEGICSIVCFLVHQDYRRRGLMQKILDRIINDYTEQGFEFIEAYPRPDALTSEKLYHGPQEFYRRNGFQTVKEFEEYQVVRRKLLK